MDSSNDDVAKRIATHAKVMANVRKHAEAQKALRNGSRRLAPKARQAATQAVLQNLARKLKRG